MALSKTTTTTTTQTVSDPMKQVKITFNMVDQTVAVAVYTDEGGSFGLDLPFEVFSPDALKATEALAESCVMQVLKAQGFTDG
jgi:hypothetical protein